jgi:predicted O-methyltransferase YrrM
MTWQQYLETIDDSHEMTTARQHLAIMCKIVEGQKWRIVEYGSHAGLSTAALALAAPDSEIVGVDKSDVVSPQAREDYWDSLGITNITQVTSDAWEHLRRSDVVDFIYHDAAHGDGVFHEYAMALANTGILAMHDWDQLTLPCRQALDRLCKSSEASAPDSKGRVLWVGHRQ